MQTRYNWWAGAVLMLRRPAQVRADVPLFLIPRVIRQEIQKAGVELERIVVKKSGRHFYNICIPTRSVNRELRAEAVWAGGTGREGA